MSKYTKIEVKTFQIVGGVAHTKLCADYGKYVIFSHHFTKRGYLRP